MGHGWTQKALQSEPDEAAVIDRCIDRIQRFTGKKMRGWLGAGLSETMTRRTFSSPAASIMSATG